MINIMKNISKIILKRKSFLLTSFLLPLILVLLFAVLYGSNSTYKIGIINNDNGELSKVIEERLEDVKAVTVINLDKNDENNIKLIFHEIEMIVTIEENFTEEILDGELSKIKVKSVSNSDIEPTIKGIIETEVQALAKIANNVPVEEVGIDKVIDKFKESKPNYEVKSTENNKVNITTSLGIMFYLIFISSGISCSLLLEDEREGTKDRVLMGKITERQYYCGNCAVFFLLSSIPALEYYIIGNILDYEFGFENKAIYLLLLLIFVLFALVFSVMVAALVKKKTVFTLIISAFALPMFMISGAFWPYELMSEGIQKIGSLLPPRWIMLAIEKLQAGESFTSILPIIGALIILIVFMFLLSIFFTKNKIVLVKDDK